MIKIPRQYFEGISPNQQINIANTNLYLEYGDQLDIIGLIKEIKPVAGFLVEMFPYDVYKVYAERYKMLKCRTYDGCDTIFVYNENNPRSIAMMAILDKLISNNELSQYGLGKIFGYPENNIEYFYKKNNDSNFSRDRAIYKKINNII